LDSVGDGSDVGAADDTATDVGKTFSVAGTFVDVDSQPGISVAASTSIASNRVFT